MLFYFDSSIILATLLDEKRKDEADNLWKSATIRISSILLKLETITVLRRPYEHNKSKLDSTWITQKTNELQEYLQEINFRIVDEEIEKIVFLKKELAKCRTPDAIHVATAIEMSSLVPQTEFYFFTFDREMANLAKLLKFKTNQVKEGEYL